MFVKVVIVVVAVGAVVGGSAALTSQVDQDRAACPIDAPGRQLPVGAPGRADGDRGHAPAHVMMGPTCNLVEMVGPEDSAYRPDVAGATRADRARAQKLLRGVNQFCRTHSAPELMATWVPGETNPARPTHFFNPDRRGSLGLDPSNPRAVLIYEQRIGGVMFTGVPLPSLGSIPRAHSHDMSRPWEMVHVYCTTNLTEAFTPDRQLGVMADVITLRGRARPLVSHSVQPRLGAVLSLVREYAGEDLRRVDPGAMPTSGLADPVLWAKREELRQSLMLLSEPQLKRVLWLLGGTNTVGGE